MLARHLLVLRAIFWGDPSPLQPTFGPVVPAGAVCRVRRRLPGGDATAAAHRRRKSLGPGPWIVAGDPARSEAA
ncbi:hypothetical protein NDU88_006692 [Pleurodeles waltl]|uniref:Uncharacterized protein n=1 Tax=Pleurodeles waltl TaxID=8319 RepID=A0AAV7LR72_PLEWA|nr:hypothetical protein NDU88_006692 [Pleurodeles waltl]